MTSVARELPRAPGIEAGAVTAVRQARAAGA